ncbi:Bifunctional purine biosynthesis protein PurH, partial [Linderina pennispora]
MTANSDIEHGDAGRAAGVPAGTIEQSPLLHNGGNATSNLTALVSSGDGPRSMDSGITRTCLASAIIMAIAPLQYGYHIAELNTPKGIITKCDSGAAHGGRLPLCLPMNDNMYSLATSIFAIGGLFGSLAAGWMAERWGRRGALMYNNLPFVIGPLLMAFALTPGMLVAGRLISGIGSGASIVIAPLYLSEIAPVKLRGTLNLLNQLSIVVGILVTL